MFSYSSPSCTQRLLAPSEKAGTKTICPKCLKPLTVPAPDRLAAVELENVIEPGTHSVIDLDSGGFAQPYTVARESDPASTDRAHPQDIDLESEIASAETLSPASVSVMTPPPLMTARGGGSGRLSLGSDLPGAVGLRPTGLFSVDLTAELSAVLSMRMAPPPETSSERKVTTAAWIIGSFSAIAIWVAGVFVQPEWFICVAILGAALVAFGLLWRAHLAGRNSRPIQAVLALVPPITLFRLFQPTHDHGLRPLRFVGAGAAALALFVLGPAAHSAAGQAMKIQSGSTVTLEESPTARLTSLEGKTDPLLSYLRELPYLPAFKSANAEEKGALKVRLETLAKSTDTDIAYAAGNALRCLNDQSPK